MLAHGCLIDGKGISSCQTETTQTRVFILFLPETLLTSDKEHQTMTTYNTNRHCRFAFTLVWDNLCRKSSAFHNNSLCIIWGANKVIYGQLENRE